MNKVNIPLDNTYIKDFSEKEIDDIFISYLILSEGDFSFTIYDMKCYFIHYPKLNSMQELYDKVYSCLELMMNKNFVFCYNSHGEILDFHELNKHKKKLFKTMHDPRNEDVYLYEFSFDTTPTGDEFAETHQEKFTLALNALKKLDNP